MTEQLSEMTLQELWQLFPIFLVPHRAEWQTFYAEQAAKIKTFLTGTAVERISHIGSTSVDGIQAKNIVDILIEVTDKNTLKTVQTRMEQNGWTTMSADDKRVSMNQGYTPNGFADKVFHAHLRPVGDNDELYFRDWLRDNQAVAREYETLKLSLRQKYEHDRDGYTNAKTGFIKRETALAKKKYSGRY